VQIQNAFLHYRGYDGFGSTPPVMQDEAAFQTSASGSTAFAASTVGSSLVKPGHHNARR